MLHFLSDEWIEALDGALAGDASVATATAGMRLAIDNVIVDGRPTGTITYTMTFDHGANHVEVGRDEQGDISFACDRATAAAIATGAESAQAAFMAGRLRIGGDTRALISAQHVLAAVNDCFADVREQTIYAESH